MRNEFEMKTCLLVRTGLVAVFGLVTMAAGAQDVGATQVWSDEDSVMVSLIHSHVLGSGHC